jgi:hypothetical protein
LPNPAGSMFVVGGTPAASPTVPPVGFEPTLGPF